MQIEYKGNSLADGERIGFTMYLERLPGDVVLPRRWVMKWFVHHNGILIMEEEDESA